MYGILILALIEGERMNTYNLHAMISVTVDIPEVTAYSHEEAIKQAEESMMSGQRPDFFDIVRNPRGMVEWDEEPTLQWLVDEEGDDDYEISTFHCGHCLEACFHTEPECNLLAIIEGLLPLVGQSIQYKDAIYMNTPIPLFREHELLRRAKQAIANSKKGAHSNG